MKQTATARWNQKAARDILPRQSGEGLFIKLLVEKGLPLGNGKRITSKRREDSLLM